MNSTREINNEVHSLEEIDSTAGLTLPEYIRKHRGDWGDSIAFESGETGVKYTHSEVLEHSRAFASGLLKHGFLKGEIVAVVLPNVPEYCAIIFGLWEAGLVASLINPAYTATEMTSQFQLCGIKTVVTDHEGLKIISSVEGVENIIILGEAQKGCLSTFHDMIKSDIIEDKLTTGASINTTEETALMLFSSGTTGLPKAVMLTHSNVVSNAVQFCHPAVLTIERFADGRQQERALGILPFFHAFGFQTVLALTMLKGGHTVTMSKFLPPLFIKLLRVNKPTYLCLVPPIMGFLINEVITSADLESLHTIVVGGASTPKVVIQKFREKCNAVVFVGYGLTELSPVSHVCRKDKLEGGIIGSPLPQTSVKVIDVESGKSIGRNKNGEICIRGPQVMKGYLNNEEATKTMIDKDGWLHTGDFGYYDDEHDFFVIDRIKDIIKVKGFQVSPTELEGLLKTHSKVADVAIIGVPDQRAGELPRAYVVAKPEITLAEEELHDFIKDKVADFKQLKGGVEFIQQIPRNPTGKVLRKDLLSSYGQKFLGQ